MSGIMRLGFVETSVPDLAQAAPFYEKILGLQKTAATQNALYFKCWDEYDHHSVVLRQGSGPTLIRLGWKVECDSDLAAAERKIEAFGIPTQRISAQQELAMGEGISFTSPSGHVMVLYAAMEQVGKAFHVPDIMLRNPIGIAPLHIDHAFLTCEDPGLAARFMTEVLNFRVTEQCIDHHGQTIVSFLARTNTPHDIGFGGGANGKYHHVAYFIDTWEDVRRGAQILRDSEWPLDVPPSHHGGTRGQTIYFKDPGGNRLETFAGGYKTYPDFPVMNWQPEQLDRMLFYFGGPPDLASWMQPI